MFCGDYNMNLEEAPKSLINSIMELPDEYRNIIVKMALLSHQSLVEDRSKMIDNFANECNILKEQVYEILGAYIYLVKLFLQHTENEFNDKLLEIGFTSDFIEKLPLVGNKEDIILNLRNSQNVEFGKITPLKWRIDISLSNSAFLKRIPTTIVISLTLNNEDKYVIELDVKMFHKLRFNVALLLKELSALHSNVIK